MERTGTVLGQVPHSSRVDFLELLLLLLHQEGRLSSVFVSHSFKGAGLEELLRGVVLLLKRGKSFL